MNKKKFGITGSTLKWIAIITMLIDHIGASILTKQLIFMGENPDAFGGVTREFIDRYNQLFGIMRLTRNIGRIAFPIFCFLLVEGFLRTKNLKKYMLRMTLFALLSEVPFDLVFAGRPIYWGYQNVMITLLIAMFTMYGCKLLIEVVGKKIGQTKKSNVWLFLAIIVIYAVCTVSGAWVAEMLQTDYGAKGIVPIMIILFLRFDKTVQVIGGACSFYWELPAPLAFLPIWLYNGERGMKMKYFFYLFYPVHLLLLYLICLYMGLGAIPVITM